jgi:putative tricarboxylic transport membrane protein
MLAKNMLSNRIGGLFAIILGIVSIIEGIRLYPSRMSPMVGDHTLPILFGAILVILGLLIIFVKSEFFTVKFPPKDVRKVIYYSIALMFLYCFLIHYLGYTITTFLISAWLFRVFGSYKWIKCFFMSAVSTIALYLIFILWLNMPFPAGIFGI